MADTFEFTLDEESEKKLYDILTDVNTEKTPSFTITDKYGHTAEYVKVVHGRWERVKMWTGAETIFCSVCGEDCYVSDTGDDILSDYCPNCGADMRGIDNE